MNKTPKTDAMFAEVEALYPTQLYHRGDYCAKVRALHGLLFSFGFLLKEPERNLTLDNVKRPGL
jgi:hypothetical protein